MTALPAIVDELENVLKEGSTDRRIVILQRVTDLFVNNSASFNAEQIQLFDHVMGQLASEIENRAMAELSSRLAPVANAPAGVIRRLAAHDSIEVSGPVLAASQKLTDSDLVQLSQTKSQEHLAQIARRPALNAAVTDVLVDRGNSAVAHTLADNSGARFSETGFWQLVTRAEGDDGLSETVARRADIPPHLFRQILLQATDKVRQRLLSSAQPESRRPLEKILAEIASEAKHKSISRDYAAAQKHVQSLGQETERIKGELLVFAKRNKLAELISALSVLSAVPIELVEQLVHDESVMGMLVLCKAIGLDWSIMHAVVLARPTASHMKESEIDEAYATYQKLSVSAAQRLLRFWQTKKKSLR